LVAWYPGNGNANDIVGNVTGMQTGSALYVPGKVGQAFTFNGSNYFDIPSTNVPIGNAARTVQFWVSVHNTAPDHEIFVYGSKNFHRSFGIDVDGTASNADVQ